MEKDSLFQKLKKLNVPNKSEPTPPQVEIPDNAIYGWTLRLKAWELKVDFDIDLKFWKWELKNEKIGVAWRGGAYTQDEAIDLMKRLMNSRQNWGTFEKKWSKEIAKLSKLKKEVKK